jgi:hypothetical protein
MSGVYRTMPDYDLDIVGLVFESKTMSLDEGSKP